MFNYLQRIGKSLMVPVAVLPAAAILMGIGYWIDPTGWGADNQLAALLIKAGAALIDNMAILFAIGVAYGMSSDKNGAAALSGLVGFQVVITLLAPGAVAQIRGIDPELVPAAFSKINNQFIGILVGAISGALYNKFKSVELHKALSFFSGRRLVPILAAVSMTILSLALMFIWPVIYNALVSFGEFIVGLGAAGAGLYGFFNRLLLPVGLHHALNSVFWFDVAGINDIGNFWAGTGTKGVTGMYQAGFFPVMMFGLVGAALAFVKTARPENKVKVGSIMLAAGFATFFTGVTEPVEFSFMFLAPALYGVHAVLTGLSLFIAAAFHWTAGFAFSAGFVDFVLSSRLPLANMPYMLLVQGVVYLAIYYFLFVFLIRRFNLKTPGREIEEDEMTQDTIGTSSHAEKAQLIFEYLGGKENIIEIDNCATRLRLKVKDSSTINKDAIKKIALGVLSPSADSVQVIIGPTVEFVADELKKL